MSICLYSFSQVVVGRVPQISIRTPKYEVAVGETISLHAGMWEWDGRFHNEDEGGEFDCFDCRSAAVVWSVRGSDSFSADDDGAVVPYTGASENELKRYETTKIEILILTVFFPC